MIKLNDYSNFKIEDFRYNHINDWWARFVLRTNGILVVLLLIITFNLLGVMILTSLGGLLLSIALVIVGFIVTFACSRSTLFIADKKLPYIMNSFIAVISTYIGYLGVFFYLPFFISIEVRFLELARSSFLVIFALVFQLCFTLNPQNRTSLKVISALVSLLILAYDILLVPNGSVEFIIRKIQEAIEKFLVLEHKTT
ncbi:MAG: hypothetical protein ACXADY_08045 [Candidatus Hodarchaeales archaeon]